MKFGLYDHQIKMIQEVLAKFPTIKEVWLYGSRARGDFGRASDIDLCLVDDVDFDLLLRIGGELGELYIPYKFDLVRFNELQNLKLKENILKDKKVFYQN